VKNDTINCINQAPSAIFITDENIKVTYSNDEFARITGFLQDQILGLPISAIKPVNENSKIYNIISDELKSTGKWSGEIWNRHKSGRAFYGKIEINAVTDSQNKITNYVGVLCDITAQKRLEERIIKHNRSDPLTGLPDRALFIDRLERLCSHYRRDKAPSMVAVIRIDDFEAITDSYGFDAGDELLRKVTVRLKNCLRDSDTIAILNGDQFAILLPELDKPKDVTHVCKKLLSRLSDTFLIQHDCRVFVTVSIGIASLATDSQLPLELIQCAETALHQASIEGRNLFRFFSKEMNAQIRQRLQIERDLFDAIQLQHLELHFHPILRSSDKTVVGAEALVRWNREGYGQIPPCEFLPIAEETGLIVQIGDWVLTEVANFLIVNKRRGGGKLRISVNISPRQLRDSEIFKMVCETLQENHLPLDSIVLEIQESCIEEITSNEEEVMRKISGMGLDISIDNYGTGYTSLQRLRKLPIKSLKIDKVIIRNLGSDPDQAILTDAIIALSRTLGIKTVADGIETEEQWRYMQDKSCDLAQGYLFSRPMTMDDFIIFASDRTKQDA